MTNIRSKLLVLAACVAVLLPAVALGAGMFPDVLSGHPHKGAIESLARDGIVKGNQNGMFDPDRSVNRAEFLTLLYRATNRTTPAPKSQCFIDVALDAWYAAIVCDAAAKAFVQGYADGRFGPGDPVTRTQALKMIFTVFGFEAKDITESDRDLIKFVDVSVAAWYTKYIIGAYTSQILPIPGQIGSRFYPDKELLRGEAASYIFNALNMKSKAALSSSVAMSRSSSSAPEDDVRQVSFPFTDNSVFKGKKPIAYVFSTTGARTVIKTEITIVGFYSSAVTCRLYRLDETGFSSEYYLGAETTNSCMVVAAVPAGKYQLQIQPTVENAAYTVAGTTVTSDGNDGFMDATELNSTTPRTDMLAPNDMYDWYSFNVTTEMTGIISVAGSNTLKCIIYTPLSVDQFGFTGPECNKEYRFQPGEEYMVGVGRIGATELAKKVTYTIKWQ